MAKEQVVLIHENPKYKGYKGTLQEKYPIIVNNEIAATTDGGGDFMSNETELLKQQIKNLEKQFDIKLNSRDQIIDAKLENLSLKMDNTQNVILGEIKSLKSDINLQVTNQINALKTELATKNKENRNSTWMIMGVAVAAATLIATIAIPIVQSFLVK